MVLFFPLIVLIIFFWYDLLPIYELSQIIICFNFHVNLFSSFFFHLFCIFFLWYVFQAVPYIKHNVMFFCHIQLHNFRQNKIFLKNYFDGVLFKRINIILFVIVLFMLFNVQRCALWCSIYCLFSLVY